MKPLLAALRFLTVFPLPGTAGTAEDDLSQSVPWFVVVGLVLGGIAAAVAWGLSLVAPPLIVAALLVVALIGFSGGLHCDGLADTADGFYSARTRDRVLEIMQDSRTGAMGVLALACVLLVKFAALASVASLGVDATWRVILLTPAAGRAALAIHMALLPYARDTGLAAVFYRRPRWPAALAAAIVLTTAGYVVLGGRGLAVAVASLVVAAVASGYVYRKIGGATGDTLGAVCEVTELVPALAMAVSIASAEAAR